MYMYVEGMQMREGGWLTSPFVLPALRKQLKHDPNHYAESRVRLAVTVHPHEPEGDALADCKVCGSNPSQRPFLSNWAMTGWTVYCFSPSTAVGGMGGNHGIIL